MRIPTHAILAQVRPGAQINKVAQDVIVIITQHTLERISSILHDDITYNEIDLSRILTGQLLSHAQREGLRTVDEYKAQPFEFKVSEINNAIRRINNITLQYETTCFIIGVLTYLISEILELASLNHSRINYNNIMDSIKNDQELCIFYQKLS